MDTDVIVQSEPVAAPAVETPEPVSETAESIAEHAAQFQPESKRPVSPDVIEARRQAAATQRRDDVGKFDEGRVRHRAQSQKASVEDVKAINDLTRELRTKEAELVKVRPEVEGESPRVKALRRQIKAIESELSEVQAKPSPPASPPAARQAPPPAPATGQPSGDKEPELEEQKYLSQPDPYQAWLKDWNRWDRRREAAEAAQQAAAQQQTQAERETVTKHNQRIATFASQTPDFQTKTQAFMQQVLPAPLLRAIVEDDNGPAFVYHLAQNPSLVDDLVLMTHGRDARDTDYVASLQRRLAQHVAAVKTGSAPVRPTFTPPRPPNPVRTGSVQTTIDPPGEGSSIADHARYYGPQNRR